MCESLNRMNTCFFLLKAFLRYRCVALSFIAFVFDTCTHTDFHLPGFKKLFLTQCRVETAVLATVVP